MFNGDNLDINFQSSTNNFDIGYFNIDCHHSSLSWRNIQPDLTNMKSSRIFHSMTSSDESRTYFNIAEDNSAVEQLPLLPEDVPPISTIDDSNKMIVSKTLTKLKYPKNFRPKITTSKLKALVSKENFNNLPFDARQHLISLMPDCDRIVSGQSEDKYAYLSNTALNNEFFNRALIRFLRKLSNGKSVLSTESFINRVKRFHMTSTSTDYKSIDEMKLADTSELNTSTIRLDYDIKDVRINDHFEVQSPQNFIINTEPENQAIVKKENEVSTSKYSFNSPFISNMDNICNSLNTFNSSELQTIQNDFSDYLCNHSQHTLTSLNDMLISPMSSKYKRRNSGGNIAPTPNKRPTRSTAGQLPARLQSVSPQSGTAALNSSTVLHRLQFEVTNKVGFGRKKKKDKIKNGEYDRQNKDTKEIVKSSSFHSDTILMNLRTKLSNRIQQNTLRDYQKQYSKFDTNSICFSDMDVLNSKSPRCRSPESDNLPFSNSPSSKSVHNNFRSLGLRNAGFDNQTPTSPQWSFSSELTPQSSVESVLSQKNTRVDLEEINASDNLFDDIDSEEMPPPRRTLTVAAMREKMRAKKMAKEKQRKDYDKDFSFDVVNCDNMKNIEDYDKHSKASVMSSIMDMSQDNEDNEDENIANEFDSFLIDDYHVEIDDKMLNYSDDLDDLLLSGGNESLLEIIMKDPDAMEITNGGFGTLNSDCQHQNTMVSSDQMKCSFSNISTSMQPQCTAFNKNVFETSQPEPVLDDGPSTPVSSVCRIDNSILSQALTSVIHKSEHSNSGSKDPSTIKSALQNAYLVDGNGLSDALKLIQSLHPEAKVTTQQYFLVNSGPQLVLSQAPPAQATSSKPLIAQSPFKSTDNAANLAPASVPSSPSFTSLCDTSNKHQNNPVYSSPNTAVLFAKSSASTTLNQSPVLSSTLSVLPQFSAFSPRPSNIYSLNSSFSNKLGVVNPIQNLGCRFTSNNIQYQTTMSTASSICNQQTPIFVNQTPISSNANVQNTIGIRLQLAQNFQQNNQHLNIVQPALMNQQPLQFLSGQHSNNISLITQTQPMSKLVLLYPNLNCSQLVSTEMDATGSMRADGHHQQPQQQQQQVILLSSQPPQQHKDQTATPISLSATPSFQVLNGANLWQQLNPHALGNNLVLMNPHALGGQSFSFNYGQPQQLLSAGGNFLMMSSAPHAGVKAAPMLPQAQLSTGQQHLKASAPNNPISSLSINVVSKSNASTCAIDEDSLLQLNMNMKPLSSSSSAATNLNSNSSQNSCVEQLSNSSSSANSKLSFDDKSSCQLSKSQSDNLTDSDQEKSISSPQFQLFPSGDGRLTNGSGLVAHSNSGHCKSSSSSLMHLTVDIDSLSPSNSLYHLHGNNKISSKSISSQNDDRNTIQSPDTDYDQSDFEIPCLYSHKFESHSGGGSH